MERFVVGREDTGEVEFLLPVNLVGLDLDAIVGIEKGRIQLYGVGDSEGAPPPGQGLNGPAVLLFR